MGQRYGFQAAIQYQTDGVAGVAGWVTLSNSIDVTLNLESEETDVTTRGGNGWKQTAATLKDASIEFEMIWDTADAGFTALKDAYLNNTPIGIRCFDGLVEDESQGLVADMTVMSFTRSEQLREALKVSVMLKPTRGAAAPVWQTLNDVP